ncbi:MAG: TonB-dependent receptor [Cytophagia bacterium]|jgi:TonB-linked SusC/RagA family outer membrane protein|nr:MAG: TonB-dependent receptor [Cytophagales bacterium]TAG38572.1 MAG: TonB-dependent receptor [Cytophagia bacterium]TAG80170.1 MAG: TonB-dependent receptor [Cytophagales bacterium]
MKKQLLTFLMFVFVGSLWAQNTKITGKVIDEQTTEPVMGASVSVKGTSNGSITDANGEFSLNAPKGATLVVSSIGYVATQTVAETSPMSILLKIDSRLMSEVVVVGYGTQKKANLTGSVSQLKTDELTRRQVATASNLLQGVAPGVSVWQSSGKPGADGANIRIRGLGSIFSGTGPLIMVDGVVVNNMDTVDPNAIETLTVLKDAASTSIYGTRGANGVILITTRRGGKKGVKVGYNGFVTQQVATNIPNKVSALDHMQLSNVAQQNATGNPAAFVFPQALIERYRTSPVDNIEVFDNDWVKLLLTNSGVMQNHNVTLDAGSEKASMFASVSFLNQQGLVPNNSFQRVDVRINSDVKINDKIRLNSTLFFNQGKRIEPAGSTPEFIIRQAIGIPATGPAKFEEGQYGDAGQSNRRNPLGQAEASGIFTATTPNYLAKVGLIYNPIKNLELEASYAIDQATPNTKRFQKNYDVFVPNVGTRTADFSSRYPGTNSLSESYSFTTRSTFLAQATYSLKNTNHDLKLMTGFQSEELKSRNLGASRTDFINENLPFLNLGGANRDNSGGAFESAIAGGFGRINYAFQDRYLLEVNGRYEGSSRFSQALDKQWGFFPSASAGWVFSNEKFLSGASSILQFGKLRASYGTLGNQALPENYPFAANYTSGTDYFFNGIITQGFSLTEAANQGVSWERTTQFNVGLDLTLLRGLNITADYYVKKTNDLLLRKPIPTYVGLSPAFLNLGAMENRGWELSVNYRNKIGKLKYDVTAVLADVQNKITDLPGVPNLDEGLLRSANGYALRSYFGYKAMGYFQTKEEIAAAPTHFFTPQPGDIRYEDIDNDGKINASDRTFLGNNFPRYEYSFNTNLSYGLFDLNLFFQGVAKKENYISGTGAWPFHAADFIPSLLEMHKDYWTPTNPDANFPRLLPSIGVNGTNSSFWIKDASYLRLKNVNLGVRLPEAAAKKMGIGSARLYVSGQNLWTVTKFWKGFDPEINNNNAEFYPLMKTYTIGLNIQF